MQTDREQRVAMRDAAAAQLLKAIDAMEVLVESFGPATVSSMHPKAGLANNLSTLKKITWAVSTSRV